VGAWKISADGNRVFYAGVQTTPGMNEVHDVPLDGSQATRVLSAPFPPAGSNSPFAPFQVAPDEAHLLYIADQDTDEQLELYSDPTDGSRVSTKLSGPMIPQGDVRPDFRWTPDGTRVLYRADATQDHFTHLFSVPSDGSLAPVQLHGVMAWSFAITPDSSRAVFDAGQLFSVLVDGSAPADPLSSASQTEFVEQYLITPDGESVVFEGGYWWYDNEFEEHKAVGLYRAPADGSAEPIELLAPIPDPEVLASDQMDTRVTPDSARVVSRSLADNQLYTAPVDGSAPAERLNDLPWANTVASFAIAPDGERVAFTAWNGSTLALYGVPADGSSPPIALTIASAASLGKIEVAPTGRVTYVRTSGGVSRLFSVPIDGSLFPVELSGPFVAGGGIWDAFTSNRSYWFSPGGRWVIYKADQDTDGVVELYCAPIDGALAALKISGPMVAGGDAFDVQFVPGSRRIVYNADQEVDDRTELFTSFF
ncbi:MAG: hypothetical protein L0206_22290, partial [Actinobacteria bacterium]|nr:hypothetical protein [Actinomycetota bacterium]